MDIRTIDDRFSKMPWNQIDNVVFDIGSVLLDFNPIGVLKHFLPDRESEYPVFMRNIFKSPYWIAVDHGLLTREEAAKIMSKGDAQIEEVINQIYIHFIDMKNLIPETVEIYKLCKSHGKKVYLLSNYGEISYIDILNKFDLFHHFDGEIISSHVKMVKPDPAIFRLMQEKYSLDISRTLFIDDSPANIESCLSCGWHGLLYNYPGKLTEFFNE